MRCQGYLMPSMCVLCEKIFDARYDFREESGFGDEEAMKKQQHALLCWECRAKLMAKKFKIKK